MGVARSRWLCYIPLFILLTTFLSGFFVPEHKLVASTTAGKVFGWRPPWMTVAMHDDSWRDLRDYYVADGWVGLDPEWTERDLPDDYARNARNDTPYYTSNIAPSVRYVHLPVAKPPTQVPPRARDPAYRGIRCSSRYPTSRCVFPSQCQPAAHFAPEGEKDGSAKTWNDRAGVEFDSKDPNRVVLKTADDGGKDPRACLVWAEGMSSALTSAIDSGAMHLKGGKEGRPNGLEKSPERHVTYDAHKTPPVAYNWDSKGRWRGPLWEPLSSPTSRPYRFFDPIEAHQCLAGKEILFLGDSITRQFFYRLVNFLRGIPTNCEHIWNWGTTAYTASIDGKDYFQSECAYGNCTYPNDPLFSLTFEWHSDSDIEYNFDRIRLRNPDVVVHGMVYWWQDESMPAGEEAVEKLYASGWNGTFGWFLTPERALGRTQYVERNAGIREWMEGYSSRHPESKVTLIPADRICTPYNGCHLERDQSQAIGGDGSVDSHFMCFMTGGIPSQISEGLLGVNPPRSLDTRDLFNFNLMQTWLNTICDR